MKVIAFMPFEDFRLDGKK